MAGGGEREGMMCAVGSGGILKMRVGSRREDVVVVGGEGREREVDVLTSRRTGSLWDL